MTAYLLDTNHASPLVTARHPLRERVLAALHQHDEFYVCVPMVTELLFGLRMTKRAAKNLVVWEQLQTSFPCLIPDEADAEHAALIQAMLRKRGWQLHTVDALIAVTAIRHNLILLTTDKDFRAVPNLITENWMS